MGIIYMVAEAYVEIPPHAFLKSWRKFWPVVEKNNGNNPEAEYNPTDEL